MDDTRESQEAGPVTSRDLLRQALVDDADPRFPRWLPLPGIVLAAGWAAYQAAAADAAFLGTLAWPGGAIFVLTTLATWFGWQLEID
ncbi:MAG: hypothetical protein WD734_04085 [Dehalococcoidia bacterium]